MVLQRCHKFTYATSEHSKILIGNDLLLFSRIVFSSPLRQVSAIYNGMMAPESI